MVAAKRKIQKLMPQMPVHGSDLQNRQEIYLRIGNIAEGARERK